MGEIKQSTFLVLKRFNLHSPNKNNTGDHPIHNIKLELNSWIN